jgi:glucan phosphoethanolaminetransferase (alkaline phosphatase superfamily)
MGKTRRKLFASAVVSGFALALGLPGLADLITLVWETTRSPLEKVVPAGMTLSLISLAVFFTITYLNWQIYLKGARKGPKGLFAVVAGIMTGLVIGSFILVTVRGFLSP